MISSSKLKSVDFYRKIPRDLTEASLSGAGLSIIAALAMMFLFGMELSSYLAVNTTTIVIVDRSPDGEFLWIDFNMSFPALSCEFASVDVSDVLGTMEGLAVDNKVSCYDMIEQYCVNTMKQLNNLQKQNPRHMFTKRYGKFIGPFLSSEFVQKLQDESAFTNEEKVQMIMTGLNFGV